MAKPVSSSESFIIVDGKSDKRFIAWASPKENKASSELTNQTPSRRKRRPSVLPRVQLNVDDDQEHGNVKQEPLTDKSRVKETPESDRVSWFAKHILPRPASGHNEVQPKGKTLGEEGKSSPSQKTEKAKNSPERKTFTPEKTPGKVETAGEEDRSQKTEKAKNSPERKRPTPEKTPAVASETMLPTKQEKNIKPHDSEPINENTSANGDVTADDITVEEDKKIKTDFRDLLFYLVFLLLVCIIASGMVSTNSYHFANGVKQLFFETPMESNNNMTIRSEAEESEGNTLANANTIAEFWQFLGTVLPAMLYWEFWHSFDDPVTHTAADDGKVLFVNQLLGVPRMRQVRMKNNSCAVHSDVKKMFVTCHDYYSMLYEDTEPFGPGGLQLTETAWIYTSGQELNNWWYLGYISWYGRGGYYLDLGTDRNQTVNMVQELKDNLWIDRGTRAVFIDFTLYNANINLFCVCKFVLEFPPGGGMIPGGLCEPLKLLRYVNEWDFFVLACEVVLVIFVVYYTVMEIRKIKMDRRDYWQNGFNYFNLFILLLCYAEIVLSIVRFLYVTFTLPLLLENFQKHPCFDFPTQLQLHFNYTVAILVFCSLVKLFKYLSLSRNIREVHETLSKCAPDLAGFSLVLIIVFFAFALLGYLLFGTKVKDYESVWSSFMALMQSVLGEFDYRQIEEAHRVLGPIFFLTFVFNIIVVLSMFIAIVIDAYSVVKSSISSRKTEVAAAKYIKRGFMNILRICCCGLNKKVQNYINTSTLHDEVVDELKSSGFSNLEIELFFRTYEITPKATDSEMAAQIQRDLELKKLDFKVPGHNNFESLKTRIDDLELKFDLVLKKLDKMKKD